MVKKEDIFFSQVLLLVLLIFKKLLLGFRFVYYYFILSRLDIDISLFILADFTQRASESVSAPELVSKQTLGLAPNKSEVTLSLILFISYL